MAHGILHSNTKICAFRCAKINAALPFVPGDAGIHSCRRIVMPCSRSCNGRFLTRASPRQRLTEKDHQDLPHLPLCSHRAVRPRRSRPVRRHRPSSPFRFRPIDAAKRQVVVSESASVGGTDVKLAYTTLFRSGDKLGEPVFGQIHDKDGRPVPQGDAGRLPTSRTSPRSFRSAARSSPSPISKPCPPPCI